ncbi:hypothetical protein GCM10023169_26090 [Georgenia halophila]|uniref:DUF4129 domain-containing protein n=1 Tax=Georgenia halophila TaxID=620889 RepID=A0ABP8LCV8_9MICO
MSDGLRRWRRLTIAAVVTMAVLGTTLWQGGLLPAPWPVGVAVTVVAGLALVLAVWTLVQNLDLLTPASWFGPQDLEVPPSRPGLDARLARLRRHLRDTVERDDRPDAMQELLRELAADRLAARGVDLDADPQAAEALMHPSLTRYLAHSPQDTRPRNRRELADVVGRIEEL